MLSPSPIVVDVVCSSSSSSSNIFRRNAKDEEEDPLTFGLFQNIGPGNQSSFPELSSSSAYPEATGLHQTKRPFVLFSAVTEEHGREPWIIITHRLADTDPGNNSSSNNNNNSTSSNTTTTTTNRPTTPVAQLLMDINPGPNSSVPDASEVENEEWFSVLGPPQVTWDQQGTVFQSVWFEDKMYFTAFHPDYGTELWVTDGTTTQLWMDLLPGPNSSNPQGLFIKRGVVGMDGSGGVDYEDEYFLFTACRDEKTKRRGLYVVQSSARTMTTTNDTNDTNAANGTARTTAGEPVELPLTAGHPAYSNAESLYLLQYHPLPAQGLLGIVLRVEQDTARWGSVIQQLWITDGTVDGTFPTHAADQLLVSSIVFSGDPTTTTRTDNDIYFYGENKKGVSETWKTNGVRNDTTLVVSDVILSSSSFMNSDDGSNSTYQSQNAIFIFQFAVMELWEVFSNGTLQVHEPFPSEIRFGGYRSPHPLLLPDSGAEGVEEAYFYYVLLWDQTKPFPNGQLWKVNCHDLSYRVLDDRMGRFINPVSYLTLPDGRFLLENVRYSGAAYNSQISFIDPSSTVIARKVFLFDLYQPDWNWPSDNQVKMISDTTILVKGYTIQDGLEWYKFDIPPKNATTNDHNSQNSSAEPNSEWNVPSSAESQSFFLVMALSVIIVEYF